MISDKIIITIFSVLGIVFTYWFFLMKKEKVVSVTDTVDIVVKGGYTPNTISISQGKTTSPPSRSVWTAALIAFGSILSICIGRILPDSDLVRLYLLDRGCSSQVYGLPGAVV